MDETLAPSDETYTNPKPQTKLSPENQQFVQTTEFQELFGDSKIVDRETGEPELWYHGTNRSFDNFKLPGQEGIMSNYGLDHDSEGVYLTDSYERAAGYADPIGTNFAWLMQKLAELNPGSNNTYDEAFETWDQMLESFRTNDGRVTFSTGHEEDAPTFGPDEVEEAIKNKKLGFSDFVNFDGQSGFLLGEFLHFMGGKFPAADDEMVPYKSVFKDQNDLLEKLGAEFMIPKRIQPRIVPLFVRADHPVEFTADSMPQSMDWKFAEGLERHTQEPQIDAVIVEGDPGLHGRAALVFDPDRLIVAPSK